MKDFGFKRQQSPVNTRSDQSWSIRVTSLKSKAIIDQSTKSSTEFVGGRTKVETFSGYCPKFGHSLNSDSRHCRRHNRHMEDRPEFGHQIRKVQSRIRRVQSPRTTTIIKETRDDVRNLDTCKVQVQSPNGGKVQDKVQVQSPM